MSRNKPVNLEQYWRYLILNRSYRHTAETLISFGSQWRHKKDQILIV